MRLRGVVVAGCAVALACATPARGAAQDPADVAWNEGDLATAERLYGERVARDSSDGRALHRLALINAWAERYDAALALFEVLLRVAPDNLDARRDRARVLSWQGRFEASVAAYDTLARLSDDPRPARLAQAEVLSWAGELPASAAAYGRLLAADSTDLEARRGLARVVSWSGDLVRAEAEWRRAVATDSSDVGSLVGLAQTLRWQGRVAGAAAWLERGRLVAPDDPGLLEEWPSVRAEIAPRVAPGATYETDSDGNRIFTVSARGAWRPVGRLEVSVEAYGRRASWERGGIAAQHSRGAVAEARVELEPGWNLGATAGLSERGGDSANTMPRWSASITTPGRYRIGGAVSYRRSALDASALLMARGVETGELAASLRAEPWQGWALTGGVSRGTFSGTSDNVRTAGFAAATRRLGARWTGGVRVRAFGYRYDLDDGYFDPNRFVLGELLVRWRGRIGQWTIRGEAAPGVQHVGRGGGAQVTGQASAGVTYTVAPGREVDLFTAFSRSGLQTFASAAAGYRYLAVGVSARWWF